jgi:amino acid adenylation domain-containing protein/FkbH-like protein/FkbM family methyltransferase
METKLSKKPTNENPSFICLANYNIQTQAICIKNILSKANMSVDVIASANDDLIQDLLNPQSILYTIKNPSLVLIFISPCLLSISSYQEYIIALSNALNIVTARVKVQFFLILMPSIGSFEEHNQFSILEHLKNTSQVIFLNASETTAETNIFDKELLKTANTPYSFEFENKNAIFILKEIQKELDPPFKVIVVDADNTLWEGVCAESNLKDIKVLERNRQLQQFLLNCEKKGFLICIASRNIEEDVFNVIDNHSDMLIRRENITSWEINWNSKAENLALIANKLNFALNSFIFIDDSKEECELVSIKTPSVLTIHFSRKNNSIEYIKKLWVFEEIRAKANAAIRKNFYLDNSKRFDYQKLFNNYKDFIASLNLNIKLIPLNETLFNRISELSYRVTQFNCSNKKLSKNLLNQYLQDGHECFAIEASDQFGDYGCIGFISTLQNSEELVVDNFFLSCRSLNKGIEHEIIKKVCSFNKKFVTISFLFKETSRNLPARFFLDTICFDKEVHEDTFIYTTKKESAHDLNFSIGELVIDDSKNMLAIDGNRFFDNNVLLALASLEDKQENHSNNLALAPSSGQTEHIVGKIFSNFTNISNIDVTANPFSLGINSLTAIQIAAVINKTFDLNFGIKEIYENSSIKQLCELINNRNREIFPRLPSPNEEKCSASINQKALFTLDKIEATFGYNMPSAFLITGNLDKDKLFKAFNVLSTAHPILNANCFIGDEDLTLKLRKNQQLSIAYLKKDNYSDNDLINFCKQQEKKIFDLSNDQLIRVFLIKANATKHILFINIHHIIFDGWSEIIFLKQLSEIYNALVANQHVAIESYKETNNYLTFCQMQNEWIASQEAKLQLSYWKKKLSGVSYSEIKPDLDENPTSLFEGHFQKFAISNKHYNKLKQLAAKNKTTLFNLTLTAFNILISKYTNQSDILLGCPFWNRPFGLFNNTIGYFVNLVLLRTRVAENDHVAEFLKQVSKTVLEAQLNQDLPYSKVRTLPGLGASTQDLKGPRIVFAFQNDSTLKLDKTNVERLYRGYDFARFNLVLELTEKEGSIVGGIYYASNYSEKMIDGIIKAYTGLLAAFEDNLQKTVESISLYADLTDSANFNHINKSFQPKDLISIFQTQVAKNQNSIAIRDQYQTFTYRELEEISSQVAANLQQKGYKAGNIIGISLPKSVDLIIITIALAKMGITYVGLDAAHPDAYLQSIVTNSDMDAIITSNDLAQRYSSFCSVLTSRQLMDKKIATDTFKHSSINASSTLYILYTSGTTGLPKGVMISHASFCNLLVAIQNVYHFSASDKLTLFHSFGFDIGQWEIWSALLNGCELIIPNEQLIRSPKEFSDFLSENKITVLNQTPSAFEHLCESMDFFKRQNPLSLRLITFVGEPLNLKIIKKFISFGYSNIEFFDMYGITEVTVYSTIKKINLEKLDSNINNIGRPIANTAILVLDENMRRKPIGAIGEIFLAGYGLAQGYYKNSKLTQERFKFFENTLVYKSGDFGRFLGNGELEFYGRLDEQIKLRGHRFDLKDISVTINQFSGIQNNAVLSDGASLAEKILRAYIIPDLASAYPLYKISKIKIENPHINFHCLPNKLTIAHLNPLETETLYQEIFIDSEYIKNSITINEGDVVFDIGANIGMFTLRVAMSLKNVSVFAFEPIPPIFELLKTNINIYDLTNVKAFDCGIYGASQETDLVYYTGASVLSSVHANIKEEVELMSSYINKKYDHSYSLNQNTIDSLINNQLEKKVYKCKLLTISDIIIQHNIEKIDLLKIDAEKSEYQILKGIKDEHWPKIKQVVLEAHDIGKNVKDILALLKCKGFTVEVVQNSDLESTVLCMIFAIRNGAKETANKFEFKYKYKWNSEKEYLTTIQAFLKSQLPSYMLPSQYQIAAELPRTVNGKLDKKSLLNQKASAYSLDQLPKSLNRLENEIYKVWQTVLHKENFDFNDNFFEVGGNSLLLMTMFEKLEHLLPNLEISDLFKYPSIRSLALAFSKDNFMNEAKKLNSEDNSTSDDIAIIGYAYKLPMIQEGSLWENLLNGKVFIKQFSADELKANKVKNIFSTDSNFVPCCSFVDGIESFDADFFGVFPADARLMDPQHRVFLELAWQALEVAGYSPEKFKGEIGIACGVGTNHYYNKEANEKISFTSKEIFSQKDYLATKIAYKLNLTGPALNINTACSTGLVNVIKACQSLALGEADIMLAGGVTLLLPNNIGYSYEEGGALSKQGQCKPFDKEASGMVPGSGAVIFVLKKLSAAIRDNDTIHAVIKGYAVNNDGSNKVSFAAPSVTGQKKCIEKAFKQAKVNAEDIVYLEAHGTGTRLGDTLELKALEEVYKNLTDKINFCCIGSIKANFGHTDAAAGALGLLKAIMVLENSTIPPQPSCDFPIVGGNESPFYINKQLIKFENYHKEYCAAVSSFGIGGTNAHLIVQAYRQQKTTQKIVLLPNVVILSAKTYEALEVMRKNIYTFIENTPDDERDDKFFTSLCYTLQCCRNDFNFRIAYIIEDPTIMNTLTNSITANCNKVYGDVELLSDEMRKTLNEWLEGKNSDWSIFYLGKKPAKLKIPTYPFQRKKYWQLNNLSMTSIGIEHANQSPILLANTQVANNILGIFCESLGYDALELTDNFQKIGGDSLVAINILSRIEKEIGCKVTIDDIFSSPNIKTTIDKVISLLFLAKTPTHIIHLKSGSNDIPPIFMVHPGNGGVFHYQAFLENFPSTHTILGIENQIFDDSYKQFDSIEQMASFYLDKVKSTQPTGPYIFMGWSFGGAVAFEMARQLEARGENIGCVVLFDTWAKYNNLWSDAYFKWVCENSFNQYKKEEESLLIERFYDRKNILVRYKPKPVKFNVILIKAAEVDSEFLSVNDPANYWDPLVLNGIKIIQSEGNHLSIVTKPYVSKIAKQCQILLDELI